MNGSDSSFRKFEPRRKVDMRRAEITAVSPSAGHCQSDAPRRSTAAATHSPLISPSATLNNYKILLPFPFSLFFSHSTQLKKKKRKTGPRRREEEKGGKPKKRYAQPAKGFGAGPLRFQHLRPCRICCRRESNRSVVIPIDPQRRQFDLTVAPRRPCLPDHEKQQHRL